MTSGRTQTELDTFIAKRRPRWPCNSRGSRARQDYKPRFAQNYTIFLMLRDFCGIDSNGLYLNSEKENYCVVLTFPINMEQGAYFASS